MVTGREEPLSLATNYQAAAKRELTKFRIPWFSQPVDYELVACNYNAAAHQYKKANQLQLAYENYLRAADNYRKSDSTHEVINNYKNMISCLTEADWLTKVYCYEEIVDLYRNKGDFVTAIKQLMLAAQLYYDNAKYDEAVKIYHSLLSDTPDVSALQREKILLASADCYLAMIQLNFASPVDTANPANQETTVEQADNTSISQQSPCQQLADCYRQLCQLTSESQLAVCRYNLTSYLLKATICYLVIDDQVMASRLLSDYETCSRSTEIEFCHLLLDCCRTHDSDSFTQLMQKYADHYFLTDNSVISMLVMLKRHLLADNTTTSIL